MANRATSRTKRTGSRGSRARARTRRPTGQPSEKEKRRMVTSGTRKGVQMPGNGRRSRAAIQRQTKTARRTSPRSRVQPQELYTRTSDYRQQKREQRDALASTIQKSRIWLKEIMEEIGSQDEHRAHLALKAVLHTLRDRLPIEEAVQLGAQLPELIRGMYYEGWVPAGKPIKYNRVEFVDTVRKYFLHLSGINHQEYIRGVYRVLSRHVSHGELQHIIDTLPEDYVELFGQETLEGREHVLPEVR